MTYGARIYNSSGDVIIDDNEPAVVLSQEFTLTGTPTENNLFSYGFADMPELQTLALFANIPVGAFFGGSSFGYVSTEPSLTFLNLRPVNELPDPTTGYDVVFYNTSGEKTWMASASVSVLNSFTTVSVNGSFPSDADYVSLLTRLPYFAVVGQGVGEIFSIGIVRTSPSLYSWGRRSLGRGPAINVGPFPVSCMFAKSN